jgi:ferrous iron transport protein A
MLAETPLSLADLQVAETGCVRTLTGPAGLRQRLGEMGLTAGSPVRLVRVAPFGDPIEIQIRDYHLCLRRAEGRCVLIDRAEGATACTCPEPLAESCPEIARAANSARPQQGWLKRLGAGAFLFFAIKGLLWLLVPLALVSFKYLAD